MKGLRVTDKNEVFECQVLEAALLTVGEYRTYKSIIPRTPGLWWLQNSGKRYCDVMNVDANGYVFDGNYIESKLCIRPILTIVADVELAQGDKVLLFDKKWTVVSDGYGVQKIVCDGYVGNRMFDTESNYWQTSELKKWLEEQFCTE